MDNYKKVIDSLKSGKELTIEKEGTTYSLYNGFIVAKSPDGVIVNSPVVLEGLTVKAKEKRKFLSVLFARKEEKINLKQGEVYECENGKKALVLKMDNKKAICAIEGFTWILLYNKDGTVSKKTKYKRGNGYNLVRKIA